MKKILTLLALLALPLVGRADSAGTYSTSSGDLTVTTTLSAHHNDLSVQLSRNGTTSAQTSVERDPNGGTHDVLNSPEIRCDGGTFKWSNGRLKEKQADGTWKTLKKKKVGNKGQDQMERLLAGDPAPHDGVLFGDLGGVWSLTTGDRAPDDGWFCPGDETTSLP